MLINNCNYRLWQSPMFVSSTHTQVSFVKRARTHCLRAWACVGRRLFQTMYFTNHWLNRFLKISSKNYCHQARRQLSTKQRKHECLCSNDKEHMSNGCRRTDICCSSSRDCKNIKIWISKAINSFFDKQWVFYCLYFSIPFRDITHMCIRSLERL